jgi:hypothetical protein
VYMCICVHVYMCTFVYVYMFTISPKGMLAKCCHKLGEFLQWVDGPDEELRRLCHKMKNLAIQMQRILSGIRSSTGYPVHQTT